LSIAVKAANLEMINLETVKLERVRVRVTEILNGRTK